VFAPLDLFTDYTLRTVALGTAMLGAVSGGLGAFAVLRRQSLLGDAISHAALPGIALAFLLTHSRDPLILVLGAAIAGWIGTVCVHGIVRHTRVKHDAALGIVLSVFFGIGMMMLTYLQGTGLAGQAGLDRFLFGQAATLMTADLRVIGGLGTVAALVTALFWKEFKLLSFDPEYAGSLGMRVAALDLLLTSVLVLAIVIGLQSVGVVLMSAMLVAPAAAARQWTDRLGSLVGIAALFGATAGVAGAVVSATAERVPTGPAIVLAMTGLVIASLLLAPRRGIVFSWARYQRSRRALRTESVLLDLEGLAAAHVDPEHPHAAHALEVGGRAGPATRRSLAALERQGLVRRHPREEWGLTTAGLREARRLRSEAGETGEEDG
jgi:manganese/zinc/iron transport system permease protein